MDPLKGFRFFCLADTSGYVDRALGTYLNGQTSSKHLQDSASTVISLWVPPPISTPRNGLEDDFPYPWGVFSGSMLIFRGVVSNRRPKSPIQMALRRLGLRRW